MITVLGRYDFEEHLRSLDIPLDAGTTIEANHSVALRNYTSRRFDDINHGMRTGCTDPKHMRAVQLLMEALDALPIHDEPYVIRWINLTPELSDYFLNDDVFHELGFTSTSANSDFRFEGKEYKVIIQHLNGRHIASWSEFSESEVLIPANSHYKVMEFDQENKTIYLQQVTKDSLLEEANEEHGLENLL